MAKLTSITIGSWNVHGISSIAYNMYEFENYVSKFHILCLAETWIKDGEELSFSLPGYKMYNKPRLGQAKQGRPNGGLLLIIKRVLLPFIKSVGTQLEDCIYIIMDRILFGADKDILMYFTYIPHEGASVYKSRNEKNGICEMGDNILNLLAKHYDMNIFLAGDVNAR